MFLGWKKEGWNLSGERAVIETRNQISRDRGGCSLCFPLRGLPQQTVGTAGGWVGKGGERKGKEGVDDWASRTGGMGVFKLRLSFRAGFERNGLLNVGS